VFRFCLWRSALTGQGTPLAFPWSVASRQPDHHTLTIQAGLINFMSNLPKYYFRDIPAEVMEEIMQGMEKALPEPTWEEIDQWQSCQNVASTIPDWYERVEQFISDQSLVRS
jgi:hypothetical protein